jgi:hypothetical protein
MKNILFFILLILVTSCKDTYNVDTNEDIFKSSITSVYDGYEMKFNLPKDGIYILSLVDIKSGDVVSKERIKGNVGINKLNIYTNTLPKKNLYLILFDINGLELSRTWIFVK